MTNDEKKGFVLLLGLTVILGSWWIMRSDSSASPTAEDLNMGVTSGEEPDQIQGLFDQHSQASSVPVKVTTQVRSEDLPETLSDTKQPDTVILSSGEMSNTADEESLQEWDDDRDLTEATQGLETMIETPNAHDVPPEPVRLNLTYINDELGFQLDFTETWAGFEVTQHAFENVTNVCFSFTNSTPICVLQIDVYTHEAWNDLTMVPDGYYQAENERFVFAAGPLASECVQLDAFQCERYQELPEILTSFLVW